MLKTYHPELSACVRWTGITMFLLMLVIALPSFAQPHDVDEVDPNGSKRTTALASPSARNPPVLPPKWAFGVLFGSYMDQAKVLDAAQRLRRDYCGDLMWIDSSWLWNSYNGANRYICFEFDQGQFHDPKKMIGTLRDNHFHFGVWEWPYIDQSITNLYEEGQANNYFITDEKGGTGKVVSGGGWHGVTFTGQLDFTNPKAVEWWMHLNQPLLDMGLDFFKIDTYSTVAKGGATFDGSGSENLRRLYHKTYYDMTAKASGGRGFILTHRTPTPGNDQYPGMWTGDSKASWAGFEADMKTAAALDTPDTAAFWTSDTGGYNADLPEHNELYIRWLQYGTFLPINEFFSAKNTKGRFPWLFNEQAQQNFSFYTKLRYRLLPFRYSNAQIAYHEKPVRYPVRFTGSATDEIIVGNGDSEMLVAPVHVQGATSRQVELPAGKPWINYWTHESIAGGTTPTVTAPIDQVPLFVKAGSIIPMGPEMRYVDEKPANPLTLDIYPAGKSSYTLYEDDGASTDYQRGAFARTQFTSDITGGNAVVEIGAARGTYSGKPGNRTYILKINRKVSTLTQISRNGTPLDKLDSGDALNSAALGWFNDSANAIVWAKFPASTSEDSKIVIESPDFR
jgi:alpha-glucosidase (family GH31 glycosyl hydrolase)